MITQAGSTGSEHKTEQNRAAQIQRDKDINKKEQLNNMNRTNRTDTHTERNINKRKHERSRTNTNRTGQQPKGKTEQHEQNNQNRHTNRTEQTEQTGHTAMGTLQWAPFNEHTAMGTLQWATFSQKLGSQRSLAGLLRTRSQQQKCLKNRVLQKYCKNYYKIITFTFLILQICVSSRRGAPKKGTVTKSLFFLSNIN